MANADLPGGFTPIPPFRQETIFNNTPTNDIEPGDPVVRGSTGEISRLADVAAGNGVRGVALNRQSASVAGDLIIVPCDSRDQKFYAQDDGVGSTPADHQTYVGEECDIVLGAPDTDRGHSIMEIDISSHAASSKAVRLEEILDTGEPGYSKVAINARWKVSFKPQVVV